jgi:hypothetical protein
VGSSTQVSDSALSRFGRQTFAAIGSTGAGFVRKALEEELAEIEARERTDDLRSDEPRCVDGANACKRVAAHELHQGLPD